VRRILRQRKFKKVIVSLDTGEAFSGLLFDKDREALVLRSAGVLDPRADTQFTPADGELVLPWARVTTVQFP